MKRLCQACILVLGMLLSATLVSAGEFRYELADPYGSPWGAVNFAVADGLTITGGGTFSYHLNSSLPPNTYGCLTSSYFDGAGVCSYGDWVAIGGEYATFGIFTTEGEVIVQEVWWVGSVSLNGSDSFVMYGRFNP